MNYSSYRITLFLMISTAFVTLGYDINNIEILSELNKKNLIEYSPVNQPTYSEYLEYATGQKDHTNYTSQSKLGEYIPLTGNIDQLKYFFDALKNSKIKKIRVAHYGDSLIMGDIITENLREKLQELFTGKGVGFVSVVSDDYRMRRTVYQTYSDDWDFASFVTRNSEQLPYGINGSVAIPKIGSWVNYETTQYYKYSSSFDIVKIYYSGAENNSVIEYKVNGAKPVRVNLMAGDDVKEFQIASYNSRRFEFKFIGGKAPYFYGVSLESNLGIYVDNFSMRGNTGVSLLDIKSQTLKDFNKYLDYDLIILNYGTNVSSPNKGIYTLYENKMVEVIGEFKKIFPKASFLLISGGDKTIKRDSKFITNPDVPILIEAQRRIAERSNIAFWNLWEVMGGYNSMASWVDAIPPHALKDYAHFTPEGGERISELLFNAIMDAYNNYLK